MKRFVIAFVFSSLFVVFSGYVACDKHPVTTPMPPPTATFTSTFTPTNTFTPTPIPTFIFITIPNGMTTFNPSPVTFLRGDYVVWTNNDAAFHTIQPDNGSGVCQANRPIPPGASVTILFSSPATINYHCQFHGFCGALCDATCTGMVGQLFIQ